MKKCPHCNGIFSDDFEKCPQCDIVLSNYTSDDKEKDDNEIEKEKIRKKSKFFRKKLDFL